MAKENQAMEVQEQVPSEMTERMRDNPCFVPRSDIIETEDGYLIAMDMPGVDQNSIDITLEQNILTVNGHTSEVPPEGYSLALAEYRIGDYERSFRLTDKVDREKIDASYQDGVLHLVLPKAEEAKARKISVKVK
jgi:HSP20 family molecular chaperone IbpA